MKIAIYCPNCGKLIDDIDKYKGDVECGYYNNDRDKYEIKCKYCTNVIKLYKIEFNCMLCEHRNEAFIMEDYQPRRFLIHLISSECKNKKCKFFKDKREKDIWYFVKCKNKNIDVGSELIIKNAETIKICENCKAINVIFLSPGKDSYQLFLYENWFFKLINNWVLLPLTKFMLFMKEYLYLYSKCLKMVGLFKILKSNLSDKNIKMIDKIVFIIFILFSIPYALYYLTNLYISICYFIILLAILTWLTKKSVCSFKYSWLSIYVWASYLVYIVGFPSLLIIWNNIIYYILKYLNFLNNEILIFCKTIAFLCMLLQIPLSLWTKISIENLSYVYGMKERVSHEHLDVHNLLLTKTFFLVLFSIISIIAYYFVSIALKLNCIATLSIVLYFIPYIALFTVFLQHVGHVYYLTTLEWEYRNTNYYSNKYTDIFIHKLFDKIFEVFVFLFIMITSLYFGANFILKLFYAYNSNFCEVMNLIGKNICEFITLNLKLNIKDLNKHWNELVILFYYIFILLPFSLVILMISSTIRSIKLSQIAKIQEEINSKNIDDNSIDTLLKLKENLEKSNRLINIMDYAIRIIVTLFLVILTSLITNP
jgi:hypothetical protein